LRYPQNSLLSFTPKVSALTFRFPFSPQRAQRKAIFLLPLTPLSGTNGKQ